MKRLSCLFIAITLSTSLSTGCGKKQSAVQPYVQQDLQAAQLPVNNQQYPQNTQPNGDYYQNQVPQKFPPDSPDMSNPANSNLPESASPTPTAKPQIVGKKTAAATTDMSLNPDLGIVPELAPSSQPSAAPEETPPPKLPWYKRVIEKVKSIFSKD